MINTSLATVLFVVFIVLKLLGKIDWSWWWVTSPLWISAIVSFLLIIIAGLFFQKRKKWWE